MALDVVDSRAHLNRVKLCQPVLLQFGDPEVEATVTGRGS